MAAHGHVATDLSGNRSGVGQSAGSSSRTSRRRRYALSNHTLSNHTQPHAATSPLTPSLWSAAPRPRLPVHTADDLVSFLKSSPPFLLIFSLLLELACPQLRIRLHACSPPHLPSHARSVQRAAYPYSRAHTPLLHIRSCNLSHYPSQTALPGLRMRHRWYTTMRCRRRSFLPTL